MQLIGHNIILRASLGKPVNEAMLNDALVAAQIDYENDVCKTTLAVLSNQDIVFLQALAGSGKVGKISEIASHMGVTADYAQEYRKRLIDAGVVEAAGRGYVRFAVPLLQEHLCKEQ